MTTSTAAFGIGIGTLNREGDWLEVFYPQPTLGLSAATLEWIGDYCGEQPLPVDAQQRLAAQLEASGEAALAASVHAFAESDRPVACTLIANDAAPTTVPEAYLKLHLLSHRLVKPHGTNLTGIFSVLPNVAWTSAGAIDLAELPAAQLQARLAGTPLSVDSVDKFPKMTDYVVPSGVRIADTARVRLGAYLGEGTTIMHEGFVNFNAGTEGPGMIEGRISAGVMVGANSDLGGGCSTMGTLSGGGNIVISVGESCLIGANAGLGIPLGDRCTVEAGLYLTAGTKVTMLDVEGLPVETVRARELAGKSDLLFRRNSLTGTVECRTNQTAIELNAELHSHN